MQDTNPENKRGANVGVEQPQDSVDATSDLQSTLVGYLVNAATKAHQDPEADTDIFNVVPPVYRLGNNDRSEEIIEDGVRWVSWESAGQNSEILKIAGLDVFYSSFHDGQGKIEIPLGTRNAHSVLAAPESLEGEKQSVVGTTSKYLQVVYNKFGQYDTKFQWEQVGITPDQHIFIAPPNVPNSNQSTGTNSEEWKIKITRELQLLLQDDEINKHLIEEFQSSLQ